MNSLIRYVAIITIFFISLETLVRFNEQYFYALSDKMLLKIELLKERKKSNIVFLGSSRTQDGFSPEVFKSSLNGFKSLDPFNSATAGQNINRYLYNFDKLLKIKHVKYIVIELSESVFVDGDLRIELKKTQEEKKVSLEEANEIKTGVVESSLQEFLNSNLAMVRVRKAFKPKVFSRLLMIWTSENFYHDMWFRSGTLRQIFSKFYIKYYEEEELSQYKPKVFKSSDLLESTAKDSFIKLNHDGINKIINKARGSNKEILFYNPPVDKSVSLIECNDKKHDLYKKLAKKISTLILDYSCEGFPKEFLRDETHLKPKGRFFFSQILARDFKLYLKENVNAL